MTKRKNKIQVPEPPAETLGMATQYHLAATRLFAIDRDTDAPLYFLYCHAIELAFKAYLRSRRSAAPHTHDLSELLTRCQHLGMKASLDLRNMISLVESEISVHGFRYFARISTTRPEMMTRPEITFLREVADALITTVAAEIEKMPEKSSQELVCIKFIVGKPTPK